jgi:hypothetical protein
MYMKVKVPDKRIWISVVEPAHYKAGQIQTLTISWDHTEVSSSIEFLRNQLNDLRSLPCLGRIYFIYGCATMDSKRLSNLKINLCNGPITGLVRRLSYAREIRVGNPGCSKTSCTTTVLQNR